MTKKQKRNLKRIIIASAVFFPILIADILLKHVIGGAYSSGLASLIPGGFGWLLPLMLYLAIYIFIAHEIIKKAFLNIIHGQLLDENFLMVVASIGAFGLGIYTSIISGEPEGFEEGCAVILFYQVGEWFQQYAVGKSRNSISALMDIRPDFANVLKDGSFECVDPSEVKVDDIIQVKPGEKIPLDGIVLKGSSSLDTKALTGESLPQEVNEGSEVISGTVNLSSTLEIKVTKAFYDSTVSKILDLVENASSQKSKSEAFITKFSKYYTPIVVSLALAVAILTPICFGLITGNWSTWSKWIYSALSFLVVSCPCALVISVPLTFFSGIGGASKKGILVKGSIYLERFNNAKVFVFDKTGTLTKGNFAVSKVYPEEKKDEILEIASIAEKQSNHPIAISIRNAYGKEIPNDYVLEDIPGKGIIAKGKHIILCGNEKLMTANNISYTESDGIGTNVYVAYDGEFLGYITISDEIKEDAKDTIAYLNSIGVKTIMLTGDNEKIAMHVAEELGLSEFKASLLPQNKVDEVETLLRKKNEDELLCFVGDGINDAPVLMRSDIGISMGGVGSDAAIEASDIVLMHDDLKSIKEAKKIAKKTMKIVLENIVFAIAIKVSIMIIAVLFSSIPSWEALNFPVMWLSVFGDVGVAVIAILNAMRCSKTKQ